MNGQTATLRRRLNLPLLVLYGTGITVGAGIYVLIGAVAGHAGKQAPLAFVLAAVVMAFTVASYAELCTRYPVSAGEAAYIRNAFRSRLLSTITGSLTIVIGVISSAAVALGSAGYIQQFLDAPQALIAAAVVIVLTAIACWGILESVLLASLFTLIEVGGLVLIISGAAYTGLPLDPAAFTLPLDFALWPGIAFASLLAFFAFIGFEDLANVVEEAKAPERTMPAAMALTLLISTVLYVAIAVIAVSAAPVERLAASHAPLSLVFREVTGISSAAISAIAIVATLNTVLAQMTMAARVVYGMARQGDLPAALGHVNRVTATPVVATLCVMAAVLVFAVAVPLVRLAEWTSLATLLVFALVNCALIKLRWGKPRPLGAHFTVPLWVPVLGLLTSLAMMAGAIL